MAVKGQDVIACNHKILLVRDFDPVEALLPTDDLVGDTWTTVRAKEGTALLDVLNIDLVTIVEGKACTLG